MSVAYHRLAARFRRLGLLADAGAILDWDRAVHMPPGSASARGEIMAELAVLRHEMLAEASVEQDLAEAESHPGSLSLWEAANLREMRRRHRHVTAIPSELQARATRVTMQSEMAWREARRTNDFKGYAPHLEAVLDIVREVAAIKADLFGCSAYEALLDEYDPGLTEAALDRIFGDLEPVLADLTPQILENEARRPAPPVPPVPVAAQQALARRVMTALGFDFERGRLDISTHPFCGGSPEDQRLTTRYDEADWRSALMGVIHETGHALYEAHLPLAWRHQPAGYARGMTLHESQSLMMEMQVARSAPFLAWLAAEAAESFGLDPAEHPGLSAGGLQRAATQVAPGFIRVDADEVTYPHHVLLRTRLERAMIAGSLEVADLPGAWAEELQTRLGLTPPDDRRGCLQDIHWPDGAFGYFPTYTLGALAAAQLFQAADERSSGAVSAELEQGRTVSLRDWLAVTVHGRGSSASTEEILREATGEPLGVEAFARHLRRRYLA